MWIIIILAAVLVIAAYILAKSSHHIGSTFGSAKVNAQISDAITFANNINAAFANDQDFSSLTNTVADTEPNSLTPSDMNGGGGAIHDVWGGAVTVAVNGANTSEYDMTYQSVPGGRTCAAFVEGVAGTGQNMVSAVTINGTAVTLPVTTGTVIQDCATSANTVDFTLTG